MKIKTNRFAVAAAILLALCLVFVAPVGAEGTETCTGCAENTAHSHVASATIYGTTTYYADIQEAIKAAAPSGTVEILTDVTVDKWVMITEDLSIGTNQLITITMNGLTINGNGKSLTVNSIESASNGNDLFRGASNLNVNDWIINCNAAGVSCAIGLKSGNITNVTFNGSIYGVKPGDGEIKIEDCTFKNNSQAIYSEDPRDKLLITRNTFDVVDGKYAIIIRGATTFTNNTVTSGKVNLADSASGIISGNDFGDNRFKVYNGATAKISGNKINNLEFNDTSEVKSTFADNTLSEAAKSVLTSKTAAKIGETYYTTLAEAVEKATNGQTVTLLKDAEGAGIMIEAADAKNIVIDFGGNTYTVTSPAVGSSGTETQAFHLEKGCTVTLKNGEIVSNGNEVLMLVQNYCDLTLENIILNGANLGEERYVLSNNCGNIVITGNTQIIAPTNGVAFDVCYYASYPSVTVTFDEKFTGTVTGKIEHTNDKDADTADYQNNAKLIIKAGTFNGAFTTVDDGANIVITGGTFSSNPSAYIASGYEVVQPGDKYLVQEYVDRSSSSSSSVKPEEPEQPEEPVVDPEVPTEEPVAGEVTVETEVTDGGEVELETPAAEGEGGSAAADEDEAKITGVVLPTGTDSEVTFVPVSEQPAPAGQEENTKKVFEINVPSYEKGKAAVIKFTMTVAELAADGKEAADVALWHFDEETGEWTKLVTSYTIVDGVVYFEAITEDFSPFAIIYEDEPADEPVEEPETPASPAPVLGLLAALGAAVVLRRK